MLTLAACCCLADTHIITKDCAALQLHSNARRSKHLLAVYRQSVGGLLGNVYRHLERTRWTLYGINLGIHALQSDER